MLALILIGFAFSIVIYLCLVIIMITGHHIFQIKASDKKTIYFYPAIVILSVIILVLLSYLLSYTLYSYAYTMVAVANGYLFYTFLCCGIYLLLFRKFILKKQHGLFITVAIPFAIGTYSLIKQQFLYVDYISLTYPGYESITRICHLTDMHLGTIYQKGFVTKIVNRIQQEEPDILVITGDIVDGSLSLKDEWLMPFNSLDIPIFYVTGNHEPFMGKGSILSLLLKTNIQHIGYTTNPIVHRNISFIGYDHEDTLNNKMKDFPSQIDSPYPVVLLGHSPKNKPKALIKYNIFLQLAGHSHQGQMFPFQLVSWLANACFYGLYSTVDKKHHVYVSSGVGTALIPMRSMTRSELGIITIKGE